MILFAFDIINDKFIVDYGRVSAILKAVFSKIESTVPENNLPAKGLMGIC